MDEMEGKVNVYSVLGDGKVILHGELEKDEKHISKWASDSFSGGGPVISGMWANGK